MRNTVVILGNGLMGPGIAAISALAGNPTVIIGRDAAKLETGRQNALAAVRELRDNDLASADAAAQAEKLITTAFDYKPHAASASMVIEAIVEDLGVKQKLFADLDAAFPADVPLLSNTSGLRITDIAALMTRHPERALTTHFWFPGHLVPLVEVVVGDKSSPALAQQVKTTLCGWGKAAIVVNKDLPGQLAGRILQAVIREAVNIVDIGLATPEDVDTAVKTGFGIRMPVWGPFEHIEAVGLDLCLNVQKTVLPGISAAQTPPEAFEKNVREGNFGCKTGKGFYDWSKKDMKKLVADRNQFIIEARKIVQRQKEQNA